MKRVVLALALLSTSAQARDLQFTLTDSDQQNLANAGAALEQCIGKTVLRHDYAFCNQLNAYLSALGERVAAEGKRAKE